LRKPTYLWRSRLGIYFFNIAIPNDVKCHLGDKTRIRRSLNTRDRSLALPLAQLWFAEVSPDLGLEPKLVSGHQLETSLPN
jgi:hypothetical protein